MSMRNGHLGERKTWLPPKVETEETNTREQKGGVKLLQDQKRCCKTRLTKAQHQLNALVAGGSQRGSKKNICAGIQKVSTEFDFIKKIFTSLIEAITLGKGGGEETKEKDVNTVIENLESELDEISKQVNETAQSTESS